MNNFYPEERISFRMGTPVFNVAYAQRGVPGAGASMSLNSVFSTRARSRPTAPPAAIRKEFPETWIYEK